MPRLPAEDGSLAVLSRDVGRGPYLAADISGRQVAYAWDVYRLGPAEAVNPKSSNRASYLAAVQLINATLSSTHTAFMAPDELARFDALKTLWRSYFDYDAEIVDAFAAGQVDKANKLILGPSYSAFFEVTSQTKVLVDSVTARSERTVADAQQAAATGRNVKIAGIGLAGVAGVAGVALTVLVTRSVVTPVARVVKSLEAMAFGDLTVQVAVEGRDEIARMAAASPTHRTDRQLLLDTVRDQAHDLG